MYIDFTSKQYFFILHALAVMITFYSNDFSSICKEVGEAYGASEADIASACAALTAVNVTAPVKSLSNKYSDILEDILHHARELPEKDAPYKYSIGLDTLSWKVVAILKTIRYATEKRDSSVLKVTDEPLPRAEGSFQIRAL